MERGEEIDKEGVREGEGVGEGRQRDRHRPGTDTDRPACPVLGV